MAEAESLYGPVTRDEAGNLDEARSLRTVCTVLKYLDSFLKAVGSHKRSLSREVTQSDFFSLTKITLAAD